MTFVVFVILHTLSQRSHTQTFPYTLIWHLYADTSFLGLRTQGPDLFLPPLIFALLVLMAVSITLATAHFSSSSMAWNQEVTSEERMEWVEWVEVNLVPPG